MRARRRSRAGPRGAQRSRVHFSAVVRGVLLGAMLARLGFDSQGLARHDLYIDGAWRHHLVTTRINPGFEGLPKV